MLRILVTSANSALTYMARMTRVALYASLVVLLTGLLLSLFKSAYMESIPVSKAQHYQGNAFYIQTPEIQAPFGIGRSDTSESPQASRLEIFVDDTPLAPHQLHADLVAGKPGFSHWENAIIFATGSPDLKASARELKIAVPVRLPSEILLIAALFVLVTMWRRHYQRISTLFRLANQFSRQAGWVAIGSFSLLIVWTVWAGYPDVPIVPIDGLGYIQWVCSVLNLLLDAYIFLCRIFPLPMRKYMSNVLARLPRSVRYLTIYDQLNPAYAKYYRKAEAEGLLARAGFVDVKTYHRHGYSWTVVGTKPE